MAKTDQCELNFTQHAHDTYAVKQYRDGRVESTTDQVAEEVPVALVYNGVSHAVMLATPQDLEDFALGFSLSEGIITSPSDLYSIDVVVQANGIELQLDVATDCFQSLKEKRRSMTGRTGCGLCGSDSLQHALRLPTEAQLTALNSAATLQITADVLLRASSAIRNKQVLQAATGATHASVFVSTTGDVLLLREDVGRHNALDKLIGALKKQGQAEGFIMTTSRASYEMVQKTVSAGVRMLVAISAPTGLAIRIAEQYGVTLVGFTREHSFVVYSDTHNCVQLD
jgi:FdhD protein